MREGKTLQFRSEFNLVVVGISISALLYFSLVAVAQANDSRNVVIGADPWCPYICDLGESQQGLMVDLAREARILETRSR